MGLFDSLCGYRTLYGPDGKPLPERGRFKVVGALVTDDELTKTTVITFPPSRLDTATNLPTPRTLVLRDASGGAAFGGTVAAENLTLTGNLTCLGGDVSFDLVECKAERFTLRADVTETRVLACSPTFTAGEWMLDAELRAVNIAPSRPITWALTVPHGAAIQSIQALLSAAAGHKALPSSKATLSLRKMPLATGVPVQLAYQEDGAPSVSAYQALHAITLDLTGGGQGSGITAATDAERYMVRLDAESDSSGPNALPGATVYAVAVTWKRLAGSKVGQD